MIPLRADTIVATVLLLVSCFSCLFLGGLVLARNPGKRTHRLFAILALNLALWSLGVLAIIHSPDQESARLWVMTTFAICAFITPGFYHFIVYFPFQRLDGMRWFVFTLYAGAAIFALLVQSPLYLRDLSVRPDGFPVVQYGPVMAAYAVFVLTGLLTSSLNLARKLRITTGVQQRQVQHFLLFGVASTFLAFLTNLLAPSLRITSLEVYGPCFMVLLMGGLAYSMIRYHLLDVRTLASRTTVYAVVTATIVGIFLVVVSLVHWAFVVRTQFSELIIATLAALLIAVVVQPVKERTQLMLDRLILHRRYDADLLLERVARHCAQFIQVPQLLELVSKEIQNTLGAQLVRFYILEDREGRALTVEYSTNEEECGKRYIHLDNLLSLVQKTEGPLVLEEVLHQRPTPERGRIAELLAELDAFALVPLKTKLNLVGVMALSEKSTHDIYTKDDLRVLSTMAGPLAATIENSRLYSRLDELNLHLERILSNMRGGVVAVDSEGKVTTMNQEAQSILGEQTPGQTLDNLEPRVAQLLRRTLREHRNIRDYETVIRSVGGESIPVALASAYFDSSDRHGGGSIVLIYDLTQIKRLESNVQRADRLTSIGTMAAGMAHEIKNPLQSIKTFSQLLPDRFEDPDFRKTFVEVVPPEVQRIDTIVSRLLDFARPRPVCFAPQNLITIIKDVLALLENQIRKHGIEVLLDFPVEIREVTADDQQLHQVFLNLFLNAIDSMKHSSSRTLSIRMFYDQTHLVRHMQPPMLDVPCVKILVSDSGCGIPTESLKQIFTPFFTTKDYGTGLGLSVVHGIITEHGGDIDVASSPGKGATFSVTFPLVDRATLAERVGA